MPRLRKETEDTMMALIDQGYSNVEISEKTGIHRKTIAKRRKEHLKRKQEEEKQEPEEIIQQEQTESTPLDTHFHMLMSCQGTNSREEAIQQAIITQKSLNPYILSHGLETPSELVAFFEEKIKEQDEVIENIQASNDRYLDRLIEIQL